MKVPFVDLKAQYVTIKKEIDFAIKNVLNKALFIGGEEVVNFEKEFSKYLEASHCVAVNSGTDALILGVRALDLKPGNEIIVPNNTFIATALAVSENKLTPIFVDTDEKDHGMDLEDLKKKITAKTKAIIIVHLFGQPEKITEIQQIIKKINPKIHLIEDACQAHGAEYKGKKVGTFGIFSAYSFYPGKNLGAYGDGGAIVTNDDQIAKKCRLFREYGQTEKYHHESIGVNTRLDTLQATILRVKLKHLDQWNKKRNKIAKRYTTLLKSIPEIITPNTFDERRSVYHLYVVRAKQRNKLQTFLKEKGIIALIHYPIPLHMQKAYSYLKYKKTDFPVSASISSELLSLPMYAELSEAQQEYVVDQIKKFYG